MAAGDGLACTDAPPAVADDVSFVRPIDEVGSQGYGACLRQISQMIAQVEGAVVEDDRAAMIV